MIEQAGERGCYIGSSRCMRSRWTQHRRRLRQGRHHSPHLQRAWRTYGEQAFRFRVLEECAVDQLLVREQIYLDAFKPSFNVTMLAGRPDSALLARTGASSRARAAVRAHCPRGHSYDDANTHRNAKGEKICRACNAARVRAFYAAETPEQRLARRRRVARYAASPAAVAQRTRYMAAHKPEKREYDRLRRERLKA